MAKTSSLALLIRSLSKAEKRYFKLYSSVQEGNKNYIVLFNILEKIKQVDLAEVRKEFRKKAPGASLEIAGKYLYELIMDALVHLKGNDNDELIIMNRSLSVAKVLFEKSLYPEVFSELQKLKKLGAARGNSLILLNASLAEMEYIRQINFRDISETDLIQHQMRIGSYIKSLSRSHQHASLYTLLKHRMIYRGNVRTSRQKQELNDLLVSEAGLVSQPAFNLFETRKTHLLFQSTYCLLVGDYQSALRAFYDLNTLFEDNKDARENLPFDYLSCLEGIMNSLHSVNRFTEIGHFLEKTQAIPDGTPYFNTLRHGIVFLYRSTLVIHYGQFEAGITLIKEYEDPLFRKAHLLSFNRQAELYLNISLIYFGNNDLGQTLKYLNRMLVDNSVYHKFPEYKTLRLIRLLVHHELGNHEFVQYEMNAFKRNISARDKTYKLEKLLFTFLRNPHQHSGPGSRKKLWEKLRPGFEQLAAEKFELHILKIFDFAIWVEAKLFRRNFISMIRDRHAAEIAAA